MFGYVPSMDWREFRHISYNCFQFTWCNNCIDGHLVLGTIG